MALTKMPPLGEGHAGRSMVIFTQRIVILGAVTLNHMGFKESVHRRASGLGLTDIP